MTTLRTSATNSTNSTNSNVTATEPSPQAAGAGRRLVPERHLPLVLRANATTSAAAGALGLFAPAWTAGVLGLDDTLWVGLVGAGLLLFAGAVVAASRLRGRALARAATVIALGDLMWVAATVPVIASGVLSGRGDIVAVAVAVGVADFAILQLVLARRAAN